MDLNRIYNNPGLECGWLALQKQLQAEKVLRESHASASLTRQIEQGFRGCSKQKKSRLTCWIDDFA